MEGLAGVGADGFGAEAVQVALLDQETHDLGARTRRMLAILTHVDVVTAAAFGPVGAQQHPAARRNAAVPALPTP